MDQEKRTRLGRPNTGSRCASSQALVSGSAAPHSALTESHCASIRASCRSAQVACMLCHACALACAREQHRHARPTARVAGSKCGAKCNALLLRYSVPQQPVPRHLHREHIKAVHVRKSLHQGIGVSAAHGHIDLPRMWLERKTVTTCHVLHQAAASETTRTPWLQC